MLSVCRTSYDICFRVSSLDRRAALQIVPTRQVFQYRNFYNGSKAGVERPENPAPSHSYLLLRRSFLGLIIPLCGKDLMIIDVMLGGSHESDPYRPRVASSVTMRLPIKKACIPRIFPKADDTRKNLKAAKER